MKKLLLFLCVTCFFGVANAQWGSALKFNGSSQYAHLGVQVDTITDNLTMEAWVNWAGTTSQLQPVVFNGGADNDGYGLLLYSNDHIAILLGNVEWGISDSVLQVGVWTHLALVRYSGYWSLYVNGKSISMSDVTNQAPITPSTDFYVGAANHGGAFFNGAIDEVRISNVARYTSNFTPPSAPFTTDANTVALYHLNEGTSDTTADASGNGNTLTLVNNPTWIAGNNSKTAGSALKFKGSNYDCVSIPQSCLSTVTNQITLESWVNPSISEMTGRIIDHISPGEADGFLLDLISGYPRVIVGDSSVTSTIDLSVGTWYYLAATYDGSTIHIYVNGTLEDSSEGSGSVPINSHDVRIGIDQIGANQYTGVIDEVRIWNTARSAGQINTDMNNFYNPIPSGLVGYWQFNEGAGAETYDAVSGTAATLENFKFDVSDGWVPSDIDVDHSLAVQATDFVAKTNIVSVTLSWKTQSEVNNAGFNVLREDPGTASGSTSVSTGFKLISSYTSSNSLKGMGTSTTGRTYDFTDSKVTSGATYQYKIQSVSTDGTTKDLTTLSVTVDIPKDYALYQNYPNPFNPSTVIRFDLKQQSTVTLEIYNVLGQRVGYWNYGTMNAGRYNEVLNMERFASGVYYYRIIAQGINGVSAEGSPQAEQRFVSMKKLVLMK